MSGNNSRNITGNNSTDEAFIGSDESVDTNNNINAEITNTNPSRKPPKIRLSNKTMKNILEILSKNTNIEPPKILASNYNPDVKVPSFEGNAYNDKAPEYCLKHAYAIEYACSRYKEDFHDSVCNENCFWHMMSEDNNYTIVPFEEYIEGLDNTIHVYIKKDVLLVEGPKLY